ncbi:hypothetical protein [Mesobacillus zeae]|uniref:hypothetical protein n=1 Tax=Mesobacillus zeae TaxID=1917180 RepID=UPI00300B65A7
MRKRAFNDVDIKGLFDPYDLDLKAKLHSSADDKNFIVKRQGKFILCCGARKKKREGICRSVAGLGTSHVGYGRCKYCGGRSTGPRTEDGKRTAKHNARKHGFYSESMTYDEFLIYEELLNEGRIDLQDEIALLKSKIHSYLGHWRRIERATGKPVKRCYYHNGRNSGYYHPGTIEDPILLQAIETLRRLIDTEGKTTGNSSISDLISIINEELSTLPIRSNKDF